MRLLISDTHRQVRHVLHILLDRMPDVEVVGECSSAQTLLESIGALAPDAVLLDWELPGMAPADLVAKLRDQCPSLVIIALGAHANQGKAALAAGADAFLSKADPPDGLLQVIRSCAKNSPDRSSSGRPR